MSQTVSKVYSYLILLLNINFNGMFNFGYTQNKSRFNPKVRYRNGKPYSPACLLENLESEKSPRIVRQMAYEKLVIRYGIDFSFETDMLVSQQKQAIAKYAEWIKTNESRFREGEWYFAGQLIHS